MLTSRSFCMKIQSSILQLTPIKGCSNINIYHLEFLQHPVFFSKLWKTLIFSRTLKRSKCSFASTSVEYLGHIIDSSGLHPSNAKVKGIQKAPPPMTITELRGNQLLPQVSSESGHSFTSTICPLT